MTETRRPTTRCLIAKTIASTAIALTLIVGVSAAAAPTTHPTAPGAWRNPDLLPALPENPQVHYEPGGAEYARAVAALLPAAIARIE